MSKNRRLFHKKSILSRVLALMLSTLLVMFVILYAVIFGGGMIEQLRQNAFDILDERVENRKNSLLSDMLRRWTNLSDSVIYVEDTIAGVLRENQAASRDLSAGSGLAEEALSSVSDRLIYLLRRNSVTGVFLVFNGDQPLSVPTGDEVQKRAGIYLRDYEPESDPEDYSDLMLERAPSGLAEKLGIALDSYWTPIYAFDANADRSFFYKPLQAAARWRDADQEDLAYWSPPFTLQNDATRIITYSIPLLDETGAPFGVLGVELTEDYLLQKLPYDEITGGNEGSYLLAVDRDNSGTFQNAISSGPFYQLFYSSENSVLSLGEKAATGDSYELSGARIEQKVYGCVKYLDLYNVNTPFEEEHWALIGMVEEQHLLRLYNNVRFFLLLTLAGTLLLGIISVIMISLFFTLPIKRLAEKVRQSDPRRPVELGKINVAEIDELSSAIESLSRNVAESYSKLSKIMQVADFQVGAFEYDKKTKSFFYTDGLLALFGQEARQEAMGRPLRLGEFQELLHSLEGCIEEKRSGESVVYHFPGEKGGRWLRMKLAEDSRRNLGVVSDVTNEYMERKKIEYERDYDLLTTLLNRRAFHTIVGRLFEKPEELPVAAALMLDLDNLKYINDTYGHDCGDQYIRRAAEVLKKHAAPHTIAARMSGDEFYLFLYGSSREELAEEIAHVEEDFQAAQLALPDGKTMKVRISGGIAWYPKDAASCEQLLRYADFAMYRVKHTTKGKFAEFELNSYHKEGFLLHNKEDLNKLIEEELVEYAFQPIVSAEDGRIFAYEALMRPMSDAFRDPLSVLAVARSQSKLYQIERLTWFKALEAFQRQSPPGGTLHLFLNSIPNQILSEQDIQSLERDYANYLGRLIVELTEEDKPSDDLTRKKWALIREWGAEIALDDYGAGYNGETALLTVSPGYVKIDRMLVTKMDMDENRRQIIKNIVDYANGHGIHVVAEGIETHEELEAVIQCGVHYLQGYYLGRPERRLSAIPKSIVREIFSLRRDIS